MNTFIYFFNGIVLVHYYNITLIYYSCDIVRTKIGSCFSLPLSLFLFPLSARLELLCKDVRAGG